MAKFSILRDEYDDDDDYEDEDLCLRSPKRRRTTSHAPPSPSPSTSQSNLFHDRHFDDDDGDGHDDDDGGEEDGDDGEDDHDDQGDDDDDVGSSEGPTKSGSMSVILSDPDVLDCSICFLPLTLPVFQCDNGHIACSSCCTKLGNRCPSCCGKIGYNRCRAIEKVIEAVRVSCCYFRYGCRETVSYCKKQEHEEICIHAPCSCPFPECIFRGSPRRLSLHMTQKHAESVVRFRYDSFFPVSVGLDDKFVVLQEERAGILFLLSHGNTVTVRCMDPSPSNGRFAYDLVLHKGDNSLRFQSFTHCTAQQVRNPPSVDYLLVPGYFYDTGGKLKLETRIWNKESSHADIRQSI